MWKGEQELIGPKTYEKDAKLYKHVKAETKQTNKNLGFLGNGIMHARTGLRTHNPACVCKQDYAYIDPCPENLKCKNRAKL